MGIKQTTFIGEAEPVLVKAGRLAVLLRISEVTVNAYRKQGMGAIWRADDRGKMAWHYVVDDCRKWVEKHTADQIKGETHGGTRANAGRPRQSVQSAVQELRHTAMQAERGPIQEDLRSSVSGGDEDEALPTSVEGIYETLTTGKMKGTQARTLQVALSAAANSQKIELERGDLLHRDDVEETWVAHIQTVRTILRGIPARASQRMRTQFRLKPEEVAAVRRIIEEEISNAEAMLSKSEGHSAEGNSAEAAEEDSAQGGEEEA